MTEVWDHPAESAEATLASGKGVRLYFGHLTRDVVNFERQSSHPHLAWIGTKNDGQGMVIDMRSIYAFEEVDPIADAAA